MKVPIWHATQRTPGHDTRRFLQGRLSISDGFKAIPSVDDSLMFLIPPTDLYTGRVVRYSPPSLEMEEDEEPFVLELYSRNSTQFAFFPGKWNDRLVGLDQAPLPRLDGNKGRFDATRAPQYYRPHNPHLAFIKRSESGQHSVDLPENTPSFLIWESAESPALNEGQVQAEYWQTLQGRARELLQEVKELWVRGDSIQSWPGFLEACPNYREDSRIWRPPTRTTFDVFATALAEIQSWVKELAAWVRMARLLESRPLSECNLTMSHVKDTKADETLVGLWINGMEEKQVAWLWHIGQVPIFIVHRIRGVWDDPGPIVPAQHRVCDPIVGTPLNKSKAKTEWIALAKASGLSPVQVQYDAGIDESFSKSEEPLFLWQSSSRATVCNYPGQDMRRPTKSSSQPIHYRPLSVKVLSPQHEPWIEPPEIVRISEKGAWEHFVEDIDDEGRTCFVRLGKKAAREDESVYLYYDRRRRRVVHTDSKPILPRGLTTDVAQYGLPPPGGKYYTEQSMRIEMPASDWWYLTKFPLPEHIGIRPSLPSLSRLPKCLDCSQARNTGVNVVPNPSSLVPDTRDIRTDPVKNHLEIAIMNGRDKNFVPTIMKSRSVDGKEYDFGLILFTSLTTFLLADDTGPLVIEQESTAGLVKTTSVTMDSEHQAFVEEAIILLKQSADTAVSSELANALACTDLPPPVPGPILCFIAAPHINLLSFRAFMHKILFLFPLEISITRIRFIPHKRSNDFIVKARDRMSAAWLFRAFAAATPCSEYCMRVSLVQISEWKSIIRQDTEEWGIQNALLPTFEEVKAFMIRYAKKPTQAVQWCISDVPDAVNLPTSPETGSEQKKPTRRGGRKRRQMDAYGPLNSRDFNESDIPATYNLSP
ncbi:hypothetical protein VKT23_016946 [Stygiomarasmius scandens]|uniref:Uncharacterized protein n=1 Tax=Marasmiellus scandens TaxID=2682957 RepID=A0ABR1IXQ1_9AGAR